MNTVFQPGLNAGLPAGMNPALLSSMYPAPPPISSMISDAEKASRAAELQARIQSRLATIKLGGLNAVTPTGLVFSMKNCWCWFLLIKNSF